jgi:O-methyltransferase
MRRELLRLNAFFKGIVIMARPHILLGFLRKPLLSISNILSLTKWISRQDQKNIFNDFYSAKRDYNKRYQLYNYLIDTQNLKNNKIDYLEFGVSTAMSFKWWVANNKHPESKFYGFDTFEGLPESWGTYKKGAMAANIPVIDDSRVNFVPGLFQDSVPKFLLENPLNNSTRKIFHLDADLFSSTLYALTSFAPYIKKGDILLFDEFNVPNHEFFAFKCFSESFYIKTKLLGAVNNYYQVALLIE